MLDLHFIDGVTLVRNLLLEELNFILKLLIFFLETLVLIFEGDKLLKDVRNMLFSWRPGILFEFQVILQSLNLSLEVIDDDFVLAVNLGLVVLLAQVYPFVQLRNHAVCLPIQVVKVRVLLDVYARSIPLSNAVDHCLEVGLVRPLLTLIYIWLTH